MKAKKPTLQVTTKKHTRDYVSCALESFFEATPKENKTIISLPEKQWATEEETLMLQQKHKVPVSLLCYEYNKEVYESNLRNSVTCELLHTESKNSPTSFASPQRKTAKDFSFQYLNKPLPPLRYANIFNTPVFAWYDYCGIPNESKLQEVTCELPKHSVLAVTFNISNRNNSLYDSDLINPENVQKDLLKRFDKGSSGAKFDKCIHFQYYKCLKENMVLLIFTNSTRIETSFQKKAKKVKQIFPAKPDIITKEFLTKLEKEGYSRKLIREHYKISYAQYRKTINTERKKVPQSLGDLIRKIYLATPEDRREALKVEVCTQWKIHPRQYAGIVAHTAGKFAERKK